MSRLKILLYTIEDITEGEAEELFENFKNEVWVADLDAVELDYELVGAKKE